MAVRKEKNLMLGSLILAVQKEKKTSYWEA
jgi:hypothetical protein